MSAPASFQANYDYNMPIGKPGRIADCGFKNTLSPVAVEPIPAAVMVIRPVGLEYQVSLPRDNQTNVVLNGDLEAGNIINATVNGVAIAPIAFDDYGSHLATMQAVADAISLIPTVASANVGGTSDRIITVISVAGTASTVSVFTVTSGAAQPSVLINSALAGQFFGISQDIYGRMNNWAPQANMNLSASGFDPMPYLRGEVVPVLTQGRIYVVPETLVRPGDAVYVRAMPNGANTQLGALRNNSDGGTAIQMSAGNVLWREGNASIGDVAVIELNLP